MNNSIDSIREIRTRILVAIHAAGSGHPGGSLSCADLILALFTGILKDPVNMNNPCRDRFVLSKGHAVPALYAMLSLLGKISESELLTLRKFKSPLQGHPVRMYMPEVEASTGSLGQGMAISQGMALASQIDGNPFNVYCLIGDGEFQEGQIWETMMSAPNFKLDNFTVILDYNRAQIDGFIKDVMDISPVKAKVESFNWECLEIDGHDRGEIIKALRKPRIAQKPRFVIANTVKGKGVSFMENAVGWHGAAPNDDELKRALEEIDNG